MMKRAGACDCYVIDTRSSSWSKSSKGSSNRRSSSSGRRVESRVGGFYSRTIFVAMESLGHDCG